MDVIGFIFARGGSKGIPDKNIQILKQNSLLQIAIADLKSSNIIKDIYVSSDSDKILCQATKEEVKTITRPNELASDDSSEIYSWKHAANEIKLNNKDIMVIAPTTSPFRKVSTIDKSINLLKDQPELDGVIVASESSLHPEFNIVRIKANNIASLWSDQTERLDNRQQGHECALVTTVCFCYKAGSIKRMKHIFDGKIGYIISNQLEGMDIDTEFDLNYARFIIDSNYINNNNLNKPYF